MMTHHVVRRIGSENQLHDGYQLQGKLRNVPVEPSGALPRGENRRRSERCGKYKTDNKSEMMKNWNYEMESNPRSTNVRMCCLLRRWDLFTSLMVFGWKITNSVSVHGIS